MNLIIQQLLAFVTSWARLALVSTETVCSHLLLLLVVCPNAVMSLFSNEPKRLLMFVGAYTNLFRVGWLVGCLAGCLAGWPALAVWSGFMGIWIGISYGLALVFFFAFFLGTVLKIFRQDETGLCGMERNKNNEIKTCGWWLELWKYR